MLKCNFLKSNGCFSQALEKRGLCHLGRIAWAEPKVRDIGPGQAKDVFGHGECL
jgi:hypothetical protein